MGVALAMDAFAVSVTQGLRSGRFNPKNVAIIGLYFGGFQFLMPLLGWLLGSSFIDMISEWDHWLAFILLAVIGGKNIIDAIKESGDEDIHQESDYRLNHKELFLMAIATSIDALAVGITLSIMPDTNIWLDITIIGVITFIICFAGVAIGKVAGTKFKKQASIVGGAILIIIGARILIDGLISG